MQVLKKCKLCRRYGQKMMLNERCISQKCALVRRGNRPGMHGAKPKMLSEYAKEFNEKQKLKFSYLLKEKQLKHLFELAFKDRVKTDDALFALLEKRLDNVVYKAGFAGARTEARQLVSHGHFTVNGNKVTVPGYRVRIGDVIAIREKSKTTNAFKGIKPRLKDVKPPAWFSVDKEKIEAKITGDPHIEENVLPINLKSVIEFYGR